MSGKHSSTVRQGLASSTGRRQTGSRVLAVCAATLGALSIAVSLTPFTAEAGGDVTSPSVASSAASKSVTAARTHLLAGVDQVVDSRTVKVDVSATTTLRDRQAVTVTWSGAHPTGGRIPDHNSALAAQQEYPVVIMQCRGTDSTSVAAAQRVSPQTCWTQTSDERQRGDATSLFPPYRVDRYAAASDRQQLVGVPSPLPKACSGSEAGAQHWVAFNAADGTVYPGGPRQGCAGSPPESSTSSSTFVPGNTTYGVTDLDGTGSSRFVINTADSNASLGCSDKVPCSLVVIPIMGISCDPVGASLPIDDQTPDIFLKDAQTRCTKTGHYAPGQVTDGGTDTEDLAVSGYLWWSESNWRNRVSFPLTFAQPSNVCDLVSSAKPSYVYGSQAMVQATLQWSPAFCLDRNLFKFQHVQFSEPGSRNLLDNGSIEAALVGGPPLQDYTKPVVQAPVAVSGFAIAAVVDNHDGQQVEHVNLTPRLLAKLMTMSYPSGVGLRQDFTALKNNPLDMVADPEFRALNPNMLEYTDGYEITSASTLFSVSSDSDVISALTGYVNADPEARAWLDGTADPWGMVVNPAYKGIALPTESWPALDSNVSKAAAAVNPCLAFSPVPYLPLVAAPVSNPATVTLNMQFDISNSQIVCQNQGLPNQKLTALGRLTPGRRALFGVVALADAARYQIPTAALLTHTDSDAPTKPTDATGRTFVAPTTASLKAAADLLAPVKADGTWPVPYAALRGDAGKDAYPGTMLMSLNVPTAGLSTTEAARYATLIQFAVSQGQTPGNGNGQLPDGYLPMSAANGLAPLVAYAKDAASAIRAQQGYVPAVDGSTRPPKPTATPIPTPSPLPSTGTPASSSGGGTTSGGTGSTATPSGSAQPTASPSPSTITIVSVGKTTAISAGVLGQALPALLALSVVCGLASLALGYRRRA